MSNSSQREKMYYSLVICVCFTIFQTSNGQAIQYVSRARNFSIESETGSAYLISMKIYQDKNDHKVEAIVNITKDIHAKSIEVVMHRCTWEKFDCENFQKWKFTTGLKSIVYMSNQIWTPIFEHITPKPDIPHVKKNIYHAKGANTNTQAILTWYPEAAKYFWRADAIVNDRNDKKAFIMKIEMSLFSFVERNRKKDRGGTRSLVRQKHNFS